MVTTLFYALLLGDSLTGRLLDPSGAPVPSSRVDLLDGRGSLVAFRLTAANGEYSFTNISRGAYELRGGSSGFVVARAAVSVAGDSRCDLTLALAGVSTEITVAAEPGRVEEAGSIAQRVNAISATAIRERVTTVLADAFAEEPGVVPQRTTSTMGGIFVRGLTGRSVVVFKDGVRYTTSAQRGGVSTFFNLNDAGGLDAIEVIRGPASAGYGSDSLGGAVALRSRTVAPRLEWSPGYSSANHSFGNNLTASLGGVVVHLGAERVNTMRTGRGIDSRAAVTRFLGLRSDVMGERLPDTGFTQYGGSFHVHRRLNQRSQLTGHYERSQQDGGKRYDQLLGGDGNLVADLRNLMLDFGYLRYSVQPKAFLDDLTATVSFNAQREERVNQGGQGNPLAIISRQYEKTRVWGLNLQASRLIGRHALNAGLEGYREEAASPSTSFNPVNGSIARVRGRIPDGAVYRQFGMYGQDAWTVGRLRLSGALRYGGASYRAPAGRPFFPADSLSANAFTGRLGGVFRVAGPISVYGSWARGFRAPNMTDLGTLGLQGNGLFEAAVADLAGWNAVLGNRADDQAVSTGLPVRRLRPEFTDNLDLGFAVRSSRLVSEFTYFLFDLRQIIVSQTLLLPPGAVGQPLGDQTITRQLASGAVFVPLSTSPVQVRSNSTPLRSHGFEHRLDLKLGRGWQWHQNTTYAYLEDRRTGVAPDLEGGTPPLMTHFRLRWTRSRHWLEPYATLAGRQNRLSSLSLSDRRIGAARSRANIQNFFNNGARVRGLVANGILLPTGENLTQVQNRVLGAAMSAPLFNAIPGYAVFGVRGGWRVSEHSDLLVDFANIGDRNYRGVSWGIDGAGRSLTLRYRYSW